MTAQVQEFELQTAMGHSLGVTKFFTTAFNKEIMVISSATGVLQRYYAKFAEFFALEGFCVYTFDYSGIGKSGGNATELQKNPISLTAWGANDQAAVVALAKRTHPEAQLTLVTHSIGGQLLGFNPHYHMLDKVIFVASQGGYWNDFKGLHTIKMWLFWYVIIPSLTPIYGFFPAKKLGLFENLPKNMVYEWASWGKQTEYLMKFYDESKYYHAKFKIPILSLSFSKDSYAPKNTVDWLAGLFTNATVHRVHHQANTGERHVQHFGFFKKWAQHPYWEQCLQYIRNGTYNT
ncbi:hydrolase [Aggregatimonas sangjinii]|uniref:Hydrolase n=1 Tax=Aggregatimonas sangjinii TaxID=2583587 RepID=A0A5B7SRR2_9FLAO|nr:alpha/beta hydrolase [Aggregatimonas sangjinii]QCX00912.1 hydrolase [Aggregatimonas sangjinii]